MYPSTAPNVPASSTAANPPTALSVGDALNVLLKAGVINSPGYWKQNAAKLPYLDGLITNMASYILKGGK